MSDSSIEHPAEHSDDSEKSLHDREASQNESRPTSVAESASEESAWQEVEAELSLTPQDATPSETPPVRSARRGVDPSTPIVLVETAFLASAASLIWLINFYFPLGPVLQVFFPVPIALLYLRWGSRSAWMAALVSWLLLSVLMGPPRSILFLMPYGLMGVLLGVLWRRRARWSLSIGLAALLGTVGFFFRIWLTSMLLGEDLWLYATNQVTDLLEWLFIKLGLLFQPSLVMVQAAVVVMIIASRIVYAFTVHLVAWLLLDRLGNPIPRPPKWVQVLMDYE